MPESLENRLPLTHESRNRFSGFEDDMRTVFDCEYVPKEGSTALIVDDSTTGGTMACQVIDDLRKYGYKVYTCLVVFEPQSKDARSRLKNKQVDLISITKTHNRNQNNNHLVGGENAKDKKTDGSTEKKQLNAVFGNAERIFINFRIGCDCGCTYCYLPDLTKQYRIDDKVYSVDEVFKLVQSTPGFRTGRDGTILSFGCYSECWCNETRDSTISLMCKLAKLGNPMQLSTKMKIDISDLLKIDKELSSPNQLLIYISMPTYSYATQLEPVTNHPSDRIQILNRINELKHTRFVLYIRPVIDGKTIKDIDYYGSILKNYNIPCIVGDYFVKTNRMNENNKKNVGEGYLIETEPKDLNTVFDRLKEYGEVYRHSTELINK